MRLRREIVDFIGLDFADKRGDSTVVQQVAVVNVESVKNMVDAPRVDGAGTANHSMNFVSLFEK
jgi:hypothetical protein